MKSFLNFRILLLKMDGDIFEWISYKYNQILKLTNTLSNLVNVAFPEALGDTETRGDIDFLLL